MKKLSVLLLILIFIFICGCSAENNSSVSQSVQSDSSNDDLYNSDIVYGTFSYAEDCEKYKIGDKGVINWDLKNTTEQEVKDGYAAVTLACNELKVIYDQIVADYDEEAKVWRVNFYVKDSDDFANQVVYIDENGKTIMYLWGYNK